MYNQLNDALARERMADLARSSAPPGERRNSLRILLDVRRARRKNPAG